MPDNTQNNNQDPLEYMLTNEDINIKCLGPGLLWIGLAILAKDLAEFLAAGAYVGDAVSRFQRIYTNALNTDRPYWTCYSSMLYRQLHEIPKVPYGFARQTLSGATFEEKYDLNHQPTPERLKLLDNDLLTEAKWASYTGWALQKQAGLILREAICRDEEPPNPFEQNSNGNGNGNDNGNGNGNEGDNCATPGQNALTLALARKILHFDGFEDQPYWYPFTIYLAHLMARKGYEHLCLPEPAENANFRQQPDTSPA